MIDELEHYEITTSHPGCQLCGETTRAYTTIQGMDFCGRCAKQIQDAGPVPLVVTVGRLRAERRVGDTFRPLVGSGEP